MAKWKRFNTRIEYSSDECAESFEDMANLKSHKEKFHSGLGMCIIYV